MENPGQRNTLLPAYFGRFGGQYVPELLLPALDQLEAAFVSAMQDADFKAELAALLRDYLGRPTPVTLCRNLPLDKAGNKRDDVQIYLKREDLVHGGAHKTNQVIGQALLAKRMGKTRIIAETGAGQHGTATALACALLDLECTVYMGRLDVERQQPNVERMELMGARVVPVDSGSGTLKDAVNEALRDWTATFKDSHYLLGTAAGPHPFPTIVREFHRVISSEAKEQMLEHIGRLPDQVIACVGGGSNAIGMFADFIDEEGVALVGVEPAGEGMDTGRHGAPIQGGKIGILHGAKSFLMRSSDGQVNESHSVSAGLDYPGVGPQHAHLHDIGRAQYVGITDDEALQAFRTLSKAEGIIPALESSHALAYALKVAEDAPAGTVLLVSLSGRGDKDLNYVQGIFRDRANQAQANAAAVEPVEVSEEVAGGAVTAMPAAQELSDRYARMFERVKARGEKGAFVPFAMLGDPNPQQSLEIIEAMIAGGADALELGLPFTDPVADGPTIQRAHIRAAEAGVSAKDALELVSQIRQSHPDLPIGLLVYGNLPFAWGIDEFYARVAATGADSVLVPDVPVRESADFVAAAKRHGVNPIFIAPPSASEETLVNVAKNSSGYVYAVSRVGVTGAENASETVGLDKVAQILRDHNAAPALLGFGISQPEHVTAAIEAGAAGAITGSALVNLIGETCAEDEMYQREQVLSEQALAALKQQITARVRNLKSAT